MKTATITPTATIIATVVITTIAKIVKIKIK